MRARITWLVIATTSTMVISFVVPLCLLVRTLAEDRAMAAADQEARNVAILVAGLAEQDQLADLITVLNEGGSPTTSVLTAEGRQIGPGSPMATDPEVVRALDGEAFRTVSGGRGRVLLPVVLTDGTAVVRTVVDDDALHQGVVRAWVGIAGLGLVLMAAAALAARALGRRISSPLHDVAATAHRLREGDLDARSVVRGTEETRELAQALNGLADRTTELLASERAAVGDLSHRLRTPVTALRLDAEAVTDEMLSQRLQEHIGVLQRTIDSIVHEARRPVRENLTQQCDASVVIAERIAFWSVLAEDQARTLRTHITPGPLAVGIGPDDLRDLVDILVDNVFAHTPDGTGFTVDLDARDTGGRSWAVLTVSDEGGGFGSGRAGRPGTSGLGLEIAARVAASVDGSLHHHSPAGGGASVELRLPLWPGTH